MLRRALLGRGRFFSDPSRPWPLAPGPMTPLNDANSGVARLHALRRVPQAEWSAADWALYANYLEAEGRRAQELAISASRGLREARAKATRRKTDDRGRGMTVLHEPPQRRGGKPKSTALLAAKINRLQDQMQRKVRDGHVTAYAAIRQYRRNRNQLLGSKSAEKSLMNAMSALRRKDQESRKPRSKVTSRR